VTQSPRHTFVIAEAGVNHNGDLDRAVALVKVAAEAGADAIKFQTFKADRIAAANAPKAAYQSRNTGDDGSQIAMLKALELSDDDHRVLAAASADSGIEFMSTPFDEASATFLVKDIGVKRLKIGSGELTNAPLLLHLARTDKPVILSTGMATLDEVETALGVLAFGYTGQGAPSADAFAAAFAGNAGTAAVRDKVTLLHCTSDYPAAPETVNLAAMDTLAETFRLPVGFSDHSQGIAIPAAAVARGAIAIEKHFTLDRMLPGPDHKASLEPDELKAMIASIRTVERAIGDAAKGPVAAERDTAAVARKSLVALTDISAGTPFSETNLGVKRPGTGVSPLEFWRYLGQTAARDYARDELVDPQ
jgi:N-acetylneuraminate synthase